MPAAASRNQEIMKSPSESRYSSSMVPQEVMGFLEPLQFTCEHEFCLSFQVKDQLFNVTRQITRCMVAEPVVAQALIRHYREWRVEPPSPLRELASQLVQLRFILRQILLVSPKESAERDEYIERAVIQSGKQDAVLKKLKERLETLTKEHNEIVRGTAYKAFK